MTANRWADTIRWLLDDLVSAGIDEFEIKQGEFRLHLTREPGTAGHIVSAPGEQQTFERRGPVIQTPVAGIFYRAASPTAEPFVSEGQEIQPGQVVGLIEAMKVFNEIVAEHGGVVARFIVPNGQLVKAGDGLVELEPPA